MKTRFSYVLVAFAIALVLGYIPAPAPTSVHGDDHHPSPRYAYDMRWADGVISVSGYTDNATHSLVQQGLDEWEVASGNFFSFTYSPQGQMAGTACDDLKPGSQQVILCTCEDVIIDTGAADENRYKCGSQGDPRATEYAGVNQSFLDQHGNLNGARVLLGPSHVIDAKLCHELGHMAGLNHEPQTADSCMTEEFFTRTSPSALDAQTLQEALKRPVAGPPDQDDDSKKDKKKKHKKGKKGKGKKGKGKNKKRH